MKKTQIKELGVKARTKENASIKHNMLQISYKVLQVCTKSKLGNTKFALKAVTLIIESKRSKLYFDLSFNVLE